MIKSYHVYMKKMEDPSLSFMQLNWKTVNMLMAPANTDMLGSRFTPLAIGYQVHTGSIARLSKSRSGPYLLES